MIKDHICISHLLGETPLEYFMYVPRKSQQMMVSSLIVKPCKSIDAHHTMIVVLAGEK